MNVSSLEIYQPVSGISLCLDDRSLYVRSSWMKPRGGGGGGITWKNSYSRFEYFRHASPGEKRTRLLASLGGGELSK